MARTKFDGNGTTIKFGAGEVIAGVNTITIGGYTRTMIDDTDLGNENVKTKLAAALKECSDITFNLDLKSCAALADVEGTTDVQCTVTFPGSIGTYVAWGVISAIGDVQFQNDNSPARDVTFTLTNRNASGVETPPVLELAGAAASQG